MAFYSFLPLFFTGGTHAVALLPNRVLGAVLTGLCVLSPTPSPGLLALPHTSDAGALLLCHRMAESENNLCSLAHCG